MSTARVLVATVLVLLSTTLFGQSVNPIPMVNQPLVPTSVAPGSPGLTLSVDGTGFVSTSVVNWNGIPLSTTFVSPRRLVADVPGSDLASASTASVTVSSPAPGGGTSNAVPFTITTSTNSLAFAASTLPVGLNPGGVVVADFNNDGKADLAVVNQNQYDPTCYSRPSVGTISILLGNGDGTFSKRSTLCLPDYTGSVAGPVLMIGDFNGDGKTDLVAESINLQVFTLMVYLGNGDGTFTATTAFRDWEGIGPVTAGDFNRDGNLDLALVGFDIAHGGVFVLLGNDDGTFSYSSILPTATGYLSTGDFNNDGILDLAILSGSDGFGVPVTILLGNGDGSFTAAPSQPSVTIVSPSSITTGDFDGDGNLDLAIADAGSTALTILRGNGDGTFTQMSGEPPLSQFSNFVTTSDLNGDGKLDLVFSSAANTISVFLGNGDATFHLGYMWAMDYAPNGVAIADFNGDGRLDLAVTNSSNNTVSVLLQTRAQSGVSVSLISGQNPITINGSVTYTVVVWATPTMPTGSVTLKQGTTILGTLPLANEQANFTTTFPNAGTFPIVASYSGDQNYAPKNSKVLKQVVSKYLTFADPYFSPNPSVYGQAVSLTCYVENWEASDNQPTGTVTFRNGPFSLGTAPLVNGDAILTKADLPAGTTLITATYNGDAFNSKSTSEIVSQFVSQATTTTTVTSSPNPSLAGQNVKFTASVKSPTVKPVGTVTFTAGTTTLGQVSLAGGKGSLTTSALPNGTTTVTATYNGTANITGSSGSVVQTVK